MAARGLCGGSCCRPSSLRRPSVSERWSSARRRHLASPSTRRARAGVSGARAPPRGFPSCCYFIRGWVREETTSTMFAHAFSALLYIALLGLELRRRTSGTWACISCKKSRRNGGTHGSGTARPAWLTTTMRTAEVAVFEPHMLYVDEWQSMYSGCHAMPREADSLA